MNTSSTSSFLGFMDATSSGGNSCHTNGVSRIFFFENGSILIPNARTAEAIIESQGMIGNGYCDLDELLGELNN